jgi:hypothetical protein
LGISGVIGFSGGSWGRISSTSGTSGSGEAFMGGMVSPVSVPLEDMTHTCVEGCMSSGAPWYAPKKYGSLKITRPISMSGYASKLVWTRGKMLSMLKEWLGS